MVGYTLVPIPSNTKNTMHKIFLPAAVALGLVACTAEPAPPADAGTSAEQPAAKAQTVTLRLTGMT